MRTSDVSDTARVRACTREEAGGKCGEQAESGGTVVVLGGENKGD